MKKYLLSIYFFSLFPLLAQSQFTRFEQVYDYGLAENAFDVQQTSDGGYVLTGIQGIAIGKALIFVTKTDSLGQEEWHRFYGNPFSNDAYAIRQTQDGGFLVAGSSTGDEIHISHSDIYVLRLDALGDTLWTNTYGGMFADGTWDMELTTDNGFIICGWTQASENARIDAYILKVDELGNQEWERTYGSGDDDQFFGVEVLSDGGYIFAGMQHAVVGATQTWLVRTDALGDTLWTKLYGWEKADHAYDIKALEDGGFIIAGNTASFATDYLYDVLLYRTDSQGDTLWTKVISNGIYSCSAKAIEVLEDGNYVLAVTDYNSGESHNTVLIETNEDGTVNWMQEFETQPSEYLYSFIRTQDKGFAMVGGKRSDTNSPSAFLRKTDDQGRLVTALKPPLLASTTFNIFPNPSDGLFQIKSEGLISEKIQLVVYDQLGRKIYEDQINTDFKNYQLELSEFTPGMYYLQLRNAEEVAIIQKLILSGQD